MLPLKLTLLPAAPPKIEGTLQYKLRGSKRLLQLWKLSPEVPEIMMFWNAWNNRRNGQRNRRIFEFLEWRVAMRDLLPLPTTAHLVNAMGWHRHYLYILVIATHPGVTLPELTDVFGLTHSNHRMVIRRLALDLECLGWRIVSRPLTVQNAPWGWWLEPCPIVMRIPCWRDRQVIAGRSQGDRQSPR